MCWLAVGFPPPQRRRLRPRLRSDRPSRFANGVRSPGDDEAENGHGYNQTSTGTVGPAPARRAPHPVAGQELGGVLWVSDHDHGSSLGSRLTSVDYHTWAGLGQLVLVLAATAFGTQRHRLCRRATRVGTSVRIRTRRPGQGSPIRASSIVGTLVMNDHRRIVIRAEQSVIKRDDGNLRRGRCSQRRSTTTTPRANSSSSTSHKLNQTGDTATPHAR